MIRGKVVLVPFPFDDLSAAKVRPAVCLTEHIGPHRHIILAFISSQMPPDLGDSDILLNRTRSDFPMTGLRSDSVLRLHRLVTLTAGLIQRELGRLSPAWIQEMETKLAQIFGAGSFVLRS